MSKKSIEDNITLGVEIEFSYGSVGYAKQDKILISLAKKHKLALHNSNNDGGGYELAFYQMTVSDYKDAVSKDGRFTKFFEDVDKTLGTKICTDTSKEAGMHVHLGWNSFETVEHFLTYIAVASYIFGSESSILLNEKFCKRPAGHNYLQEIFCCNDEDYLPSKKDIVERIKRVREKSSDFLEQKYFDIINNKSTTLKQFNELKNKKSPNNSHLGSFIKESGECLAIGRKGYSTIEHRMFNSTSNIETFAKRLELIVALYKMTLPNLINVKFRENKNGIFDYIESGLGTYKPTLIDIKDDLVYCFKPILLRKKIINYTDKLLSTVLLSKKLTEQHIEKSVEKLLERIEA